MATKSRTHVTPADAAMINHAVLTIEGAIRALPTWHDRDRALGLAIAKLLDSGAVRGLSQIYSVAMTATNSYHYVEF